jgi:hypothetical protein
LYALGEGIDVKWWYTLPLAAYGAWLVAVVLLVAAQFTPLPVLPGVQTGVVAGALVFTVLGAVQLIRKGLAVLATNL